MLFYDQLLISISLQYMYIHKTVRVRYYSLSVRLHKRCILLVAFYLIYNLWVFKGYTALESKFVSGGRGNKVNHPHFVFAKNISKIVLLEVFHLIIFPVSVALQLHAIRQRIHLWPEACLAHSNVCWSKTLSSWKTPFNS